MSDTLETPELSAEITAPVEAAPEVLQAPPVPVEPEQIYEFQPTDEQGRALGGKQVIKYRTPTELAQKLTDQNILLVRKLRETTKKQRLGITDIEQIPDDAPRFDSPMEFTPRELSGEERMQLSRDMLDPEKNVEASNTMVEATLGVKPEVLRRKLSEMEANNLRLQAMMEGEAFVRDTPGYYACLDNFKTITSWMLKNNLAPVRGNFKIAFNKLTEAGLLLDAPAPAAPAPAETIAEPLPAIAPVQAAPPVEARPAARIPTGLTRSQATDADGTAHSAADAIVYDQVIKDRTGKPTGQVLRFTGLAAIDKMPADEFRRRAAHDKTFNQKYERLLSEAEKKRAQR